MLVHPLYLYILGPFLLESLRIAAPSQFAIGVSVSKMWRRDVNHLIFVTFCKFMLHAE